MKTEILVAAQRLSDADLLTRLDLLASRERDASVELVAHLAALDSRPAIYAGKGYGSLFGYCTQVLRLSEDAACNRIEAARACRRFPVILDRLASGSLSLPSVRLLARHLTPENHEAVLARACGRTRRELEALLTELAPQPDAPAFVRRLPVRNVCGGAYNDSGRTQTPSVPPLATAQGSSEQRLTSLPLTDLDGSNSTSADLLTLGASPEAPSAGRRPVVQATAPARYRMQFTIGEQAHHSFRRVQELLRREIPDGDPGAIFERAIALLREQVEKAKLAAVASPRRPPSIRPGTDDRSSRGDKPAMAATHVCRHIPRAVKRAVWSRDVGQCAFESEGGRRCSERVFLEFHHIQPYARQGPANVANISLRCRRHNQYEAELEFGPRGTGNRTVHVCRNPVQQFCAPSGARRP